MLPPYGTNVPLKNWHNALGLSKSIANNLTCSPPGKLGTVGRPPMAIIMCLPLYKLSPTLTFPSGVKTACPAIYSTWSCKTANLQSEWFLLNLVHNLPANQKDCSLSLVWKTQCNNKVGRSWYKSNNGNTTTEIFSSQ